ncbi:MULTISPECIES: biopolymer transporter ExbD [Holospora]|uniref:Biopolymer transport protein ExbD n=2 Tax=Holospora TaxID=44747 RepID=A0A061JFN1_9PROT|nr:MULTISPECIES: biopolymer transporter ExbD [Holospora]ETZ04451.1 biopolymer transport protein ExbD [Holospora undulata HU1]GAJ46713.1 biopolymer transport protein ExbD [Holospora elegans E1]
MKLRKYRRHIKSHSEINVTPLVDVMLVLLVIFIVTTPLMHSNVCVNLPKAGQGVSQSTQSAPLTVSINKDGDLLFQEQKMTSDVLLERLSVLDPDHQETIYIEADKALVYEQLVQLMICLSQSGFTKLMLVTEAQERPVSKKKSTSKNNG